MGAKPRQIIELDDNGYKVYTYSSVAEFMSATGCKNSAYVKAKLDGVHFMYQDEYEQRQRNKALKAKLIKDVCKPKSKSEDLTEEPDKMVAELGNSPAEDELHDEPENNPAEDKAPADQEEAQPKKEPVSVLDLIESRNMGYHIGAAITLLTASSENDSVEMKLSGVRQARYILDRLELMLMQA